MHNPHRVLRAVLMVSHQGLRLKARAVKGQRPGLSYAAHVGQRLLNDNPAHALGIKNFKHQVEVAIAHFLRGHQFCRIIDTAKLLGVSHRIAGRESMVLRHCLDPQNSD